MWNYSNHNTKRKAFRHLVLCLSTCYTSIFCLCQLIYFVDISMFYLAVLAPNLLWIISSFSSLYPKQYDANSHFILCYFFCFWGPHSTAYGGPQTRGHIGAIAAGLHHSHMQDPSLVCDLHHSSCFCCIMMETPTYC